MITNYISSAVIIERIHDNYNIQSEDYISKVSSWIFSALRKIGIKQQYIVNTIHGEFTEGKFMLPVTVNSVYDVAVNGKPIDYDFSNKNRNHIKLGTTIMPIISFDGKQFSYTENNPYDPSGDNIVDDSVQSCLSVFGNRTVGRGTDNRIDELSYIRYNINNGWIHLSNIESGNITIICSEVPYIYDENLDILFPIIPDNEDLIECITQYCLWYILMRGYKHPILSLSTNNPFINPAQAFTNGQMAARNSCNALSHSAKKTLSKLLHINIV